MPIFHFLDFLQIHPQAPNLSSKIFLYLFGEDLSNVGCLKKTSPLSVTEELIKEPFVSLISVSSLRGFRMRCKPFMCQYMAFVT